MKAPNSVILFFVFFMFMVSTLAGPITTYEEFYGKIIGNINELAAQHLQGSLEQNGSMTRMTCNVDVQNGECLKWVRQDNPFDTLQVLHSSQSCEGKDKHPNYDKRKSFYSFKSGSKITWVFEFEHMRDEDMGVYYCYQIDKTTEPLHRWKTFVVHE